jgi:hypothetical protein
VLGVLATILAGPTPTLAAQTGYRVMREESFRQEAGSQGRLLATVPAGTRVSGGDPVDGWVEVRLEGFIWGPSVVRTARDGHDLTVNAARGENLRAAPNGEVIARLLSGFLLDEVSREGSWVRARRTGWMPVDALEAAAGEPAAVEEGGTPPGPPPVLNRAVVARETPLARTAGGEPQGTLAGDTPVRVLARSGEWVRVQAEGWVKEGDLRPATGGVIVGVSAAEMRTRPQDFENRLLQWTIQYLSIATADELRPEIPLGRRYLLARGPLPEAGFVYLTLTPEQLREVERLPPLAQLVVVARVTVGRSRHLGNPVLELIEMQLRAP